VKLQRFTISTQAFGDVPLMRPTPAEERQGDTLLVDPWGVLAPVRDHVPGLARLIPVVSGEVFSHALHGHARPLMLVLGPTPQALLKMTKVRECALQKDCVMYDVRRCCPNKKLPECWWPQDVEEVARRASALVILAWAEGRYVVVVEGAEFSLGSGRR